MTAILYGYGLLLQTSANKFAYGRSREFCVLDGSGNKASLIIFIYRGLCLYRIDCLRRSKVQVNDGVADDKAEGSVSNPLAMALLAVLRNSQCAKYSTHFVCVFHAPITSREVVISHPLLKLKEKCVAKLYQAQDMTRQCGEETKTSYPSRLYRISPTFSAVIGKTITLISSNMTY
ncbi:hypothetical protein L873DRAFT_622660 [Choiromyces venosus 120613-1]|uniref:Uncharacterized protein n=1 Tax=Choiromyces venosus 120613-1 TaxID=1336337 RepID=A0A3N4IUV0_9PEZI|nr:hypothetical protein L873DRAFT_622660 [Choiromyces venosus 120613-1]